MSAEVKRLDGSTVDVTKLGRNERVAEILDEMIEINDAGKMPALAAVWLTPDGRWGSTWTWPEIRGAFPWDLALRGALAAILGDMASATKDADKVEDDSA